MYITYCIRMIELYSLILNRQEWSKRKTFDPEKKNEIQGIIRKEERAIYLQASLSGRVQ